MTTPDVDFVVNCYERTYREVLAPGFVEGLRAQQMFDFATVTVLINNVDDRADAEQLARRQLERGEATRAVFVADELGPALDRTGLHRRHLKRLPHFSDCCLVAVCLEGPAWLAYWDAGAELREAGNWIGPTIDFMERHPEVVVGNPNNWHEGLAEREALTIDDDIAIGYGFSDVAFLVRREALAAPIYRRIAPASWRFPLAAVEPIFEQRVDAWMRRTGGLRATFLPLTVTHPAEAGANYPARGYRERIRGRAQRRALELAARFSHPALRPYA